jgi:hypothetical protein
MSVPSEYSKSTLSERLDPSIEHYGLALTMSGWAGDRLFSFVVKDSVARIRPD